jgi:GH25 family lysozyme M1 (1,4-beta-N-acetylmuramidase)
MSFVQGIDISRWQPTVEYAKVKAAGMAFVVVKASQANFADPLFPKHWAGVKDAGMLRGAYHFFMPDVDPMKQVDIYLKTLGSDVSDLPPVLDIEAKTTAPAPYAKGAKVWLDEVEKRTGRKPIIYTAAWYWNPTLFIGGKYPEWAPNYMLWVAAYPLAAGAPSLDDIAAGKFKPALPKSWTSWTFWQYSEKGRVDGVATDGRPANTDLNIFNGSLEDFGKACNIDAAKLADLPSFTPAVSFSFEAVTEVEAGAQAPASTPTRLAEAMEAGKAAQPARKPAKKAPAKKAARKVVKKAPAKKAAKKKSAPKKKAARKPAAKKATRKTAARRRR